MKTKKILSVLLALVMTLSFGVVAFAQDDGYNWTPIPTSPEGLADGEYYIDFTDFLTAQYQHSGQVTQELLDAYIAVYNGGTYYFDYDAMILKGTLVIPAELNESGEEETAEFTDMGAAMSQFDIIHEVGATWIPVAKSAEGLNDGDWYIDLTQTDDADLVSTLQQDSTAIYVNANADSRLMKYKFSFSVPGAIRYGYLPLAQSELGYILERCPIVQYTAPQTNDTTDTTDTTDEPSNGGNSDSGLSSFIDKILEFFRKIINFFKNLFAN